MMNIPNMKMLLATLVAGLWVVGGRAATNYVDCSLADYTGHDGSSWEMAFETIQEGVDAANVGDVVLVAPGDYVKGGCPDSITDGGLSNRVLIAKKSITLKSAGGRGAARIVGKFDMRDNSATFPGLGDKAVRCICIVADSEEETPVVDGFTIADGATDKASSESDRSTNIGGGVLVSTSRGANSRNAFIVDCNITNCIATRAGGGNGGTYVRCRVEDCTTSKNNSSALRWVKLYNCLIVRNGRLNSRMDSFAVGYVRDGAGPCDVVNCTFAGNSGKALGDYPGHVYNCLFSENYNVVLGTQEATYNRCLLESTLAAKPNCITPSTDLQLFAPAIGDYRLLPTSDAVDAGDVSALDLIPEVYRDKDFDGNPRTTDGKVNIGCSQTVSPPPAGGAFVSIPRVIVNGFEGLGQHLHVFPTEYPTMYEIEVPREDYTNDTISLTGNGGVVDANYVLYPRPGENRFGVVPPLLPSQYIRVYRVDAKKTLWVQRDYAGGNGNPNGSSERPYTNIQDAVEAAGATATIIKVRPGVYDTGVSTLGNEGFSRVAVASTQVMRIESTDGPAVTTILGAEDPNGDEYGCGTDSVRCVYLAGRGAIQGFTLSGGRAGNISGGVRCSSEMSYSAVSDCVITNCVAPSAAVARNARLIRCWIVDNYFSNTSNSTYSTAIQGGCCMSCVFSSNRCFSKTDVRYPIYGMGGSMFHCSGFGVGDYNITDSNIRQVDCVWDSFYRGSVGINAPLPGEGNFARNMPIGENANSQFTLIASPLARTPPFCRPYVTSPVVYGGSATNSDYYLYATLDYDGNVIRYKNGKPTAGAFQNPLPAVVASTDGTTDGISPNGETGTGLAAGDAVTFTATKVGQRPLIGMRVNGELLEGVSSYVWTVPNGFASLPLTVEAVYGTNWYVNATSGSNDRNGSSWAEARQTLESVMTNAISGDIVTAGPGVYNAGSMKHSNVAIRSRVVVPAGVTLRSSDGAENTIICGAAASSPEDDYGNGSDAMRCAYLANGARLSGFTLTGGRTALGSDTDYTIGGGVLCPGDYRTESVNNAIIEDCIISNNVATRGGAGYRGWYKRCRITDNRATVNGSALRNAYMADCFIDRNVGTAYAIYICWGFVNCLYGDGNVNVDSPAGIYGYNRESPMANSVVLAGSIDYFNYISNSLYGTSVTLSNYRSSDTSHRVLTENLRFDAEGRPMYGHCEAIDYGSTVHRGDLAGDRDVDGGRRVYNGKIDAGCCEFDWRPVYAKAIGGYAMEVLDATANVVESENGTVIVNPGQSIEAVWNGKANGRSSEFLLPLCVTGTGVLSVTVNGETRTFTAADGETAWQFKSALAVNEVSISYDGEDGYAEILNGKRLAGFELIFR